MSTLPNDMAAERATLGAVLQGSRRGLEDVADTLRAGDFYQPRHEAIWDACMAVHRAGQRIDVPTVTAKLSRDLDRIGGPMYLVDLTSVDACPNPGQLAAYAQTVMDTALRRRLIEAATKVQQYAVDAEDPTEAALMAQQVVDDAATTARTESHGQTAGEAMAGTLDWLERDLAGIQTPWPDVDRLTHGIHNGQQLVIGARPGYGKSVVAKDLAVHVARMGFPVHFVSLEMSRPEIMTRIISGLGAVDLGRMIGRKMSEQDWQRVNDTYAKVADLPLVIDDEPTQTMAQIRARARATKRRLGGLGLVVVDYVQLVKPRDVRLPRQEQVSEMSRASKLMAKELQVPVVMLAQLNRSSADRADRLPLLTDLRESGSLEQDADQVWLLHRPDLVGNEDRLGELDVIVAKNRNGQTATAALAFQGHYSRAVSMV